MKIRCADCGCLPSECKTSLRAVDAQLYMGGMLLLDLSDNLL
jgi:hypothetical protein